jgi:hypothetical protein
MTPEAKAAAQRKRAATLQAKRERIARRDAFLLADKGRTAKLAKVEAMAADDRGEPNTRAIAEATAAKLRAVVVPRPDAPPPLPLTLGEWRLPARKGRRS